MSQWMLDLVQSVTLVTGMTIALELELTSTVCLGPPSRESRKLQKLIA